MNFLNKTFVIAVLLLQGLLTSWHAQSGIDPKYSGEPEFYKYKVDNLKITAVYDGYNVMSRKNYVVNVDSSAVNKALKSMGFPKDSIILPFTSTVIQMNNNTVVFDTGLGEKLFEQTRGKLGRFIVNFRKAGFDPLKVDKVVISHFHADHLGGLIDKNDKPVFPNATVYVPEEEYNFWMNPQNSSESDSDVIKGNFARAQKIFSIIQPVKFKQGQEFIPGVTALAADGHTPGHTSFLVKAKKNKLLIQGDLSNIPALFVEHPQWHVWSDMDKAEAEKKRIKLYNAAVKEKWFIQGFHFPFPAVGHLERDGDGFKVVPLRK